MKPVRIFSYRRVKELQIQACNRGTFPWMLNLAINSQQINLRLFNGLLKWHSWHSFQHSLLNKCLAPLKALSSFRKKVAGSGFLLQLHSLPAQVATVNSQVKSARNKTWVRVWCQLSASQKRGRLQVEQSPAVLLHKTGPIERIWESPSKTRLPQNKGWLIIMCEFKRKRKTQNIQGQQRRGICPTEINSWTSSHGFISYSCKLFTFVV